VEIGETLYLTDRKQWRKWLEKNHEIKKEIWLIYYKKHTKKPTIPYDDAVEEALCFGWIDSTVKRIDDEKHAQRYTPRNLRSVWSQYNIKRVKKLFKEGKMTKIGLSKYEYGMKHNIQAPTTRERLVVPKDLKDALKNEVNANKNFNNLSKSYKIMYVYWINSAKREETRKRRIKKAVSLLKENKKPWEN
jgi:uncharacterized protein YdeI (YjbR/CyaY-like superfamily)